MSRSDQENFLIGIKTFLESDRARCEIDTSVLVSLKDFQSLCKAAACQRSGLFPNKDGRTKTLRAVLEAVQLMLSSVNSLFFSYASTFFKAYDFPPNYGVEQITVFDLLEIGWFGSVEILGKTPAQIYVRNQNLMQLYSTPVKKTDVLPKSSSSEALLVLRDQQLALYPSVLGSSVLDDQLFQKLRGAAASPRFSFFASSAQEKAINKLILRALLPGSEPSVEKLLIILTDAHRDLSAGSTKVKVVLREAGLLDKNDRLIFKLQQPQEREQLPQVAEAEKPRERPQHSMPIPIPR